jgi:hypothetical protein
MNQEARAGYVEFGQAPMLNCACLVHLADENVPDATQSLGSGLSNT